MKSSSILVLLLVAFSCGRSKKRIRGILQKGTATVHQSHQIEVKPIDPEFQVNFQKGYNWRDITTEEKFYEMFPNIPRLPQHKKGDNGGLTPIRPGKDNKLHSLGNRGPLGQTNNAGEVDTTTHCDSRRTLIGLPIKQHMYIFPSCTWVKRCTGCMCPSSVLTCKPVKERDTTVYFYRIDGHTAKQDKIEIKEHVTCSCQCIKLPSSCNTSTHTWNVGTCDCECKPEYQRHNLNCQKPFKHDSKTCSCVCPKAQEDCPLGMRWSFSDCSCVQMEIPFLNTKKRFPDWRLPISVEQDSEDISGDKRLPR